MTRGTKEWSVILIIFPLLIVALAGTTLFFAAGALSSLSDGRDNKAKLRFNCETGVQYRPLPGTDHVWTPVVDKAGQPVLVDPARCKPSRTKAGREIHSPSRVYSYRK